MPPASSPSRSTSLIEDDAIRFISHPSFEASDAIQTYDVALPMADDTGEATYLQDEDTRSLARQMHYAAYRLHNTVTDADPQYWRSRYYALRNQIVLGNRKLVYRMVGRWLGLAYCSDDLIGECYLVLIRAITAYDPWYGVRFSTYACTCLMRALSRLSRRWSGDRLLQAVPLDGNAPTYRVSRENPGEPRAAVERLNELLDDDHPLLSTREKTILRRRYGANSPTLAALGSELGLSKERIRQVEVSAITKLHKALSGVPLSQ
jgi:RNA polymerase sigma factor (sigma-70 family)